MLITLDMNLKPWKYATHCLSADKHGSIFIVSEGEQQHIYIDSCWEPSDVYLGILEEIQTEYHVGHDEKFYLVERNLINKYQKILDDEGSKVLDRIYLKLCDSDNNESMSDILAIQVVIQNNDLDL